MNPNEHHPGPRCSCTDCLARWPDDPFAGLPLKQLNQLAYRGYTAVEAGAIIIWLQDRIKGYPCAHFGLGPLGGICPHCKCIFDKGDLPC